MKTIEQVKSEYKSATGYDMPIYTYNGKLGVLYDADCVAEFIPMDKFLAMDNIDYGSVRWVTEYPGGDEGEEITDAPIRNEENEQKLLVDGVWSPVDANKSDEYVRELLVTTDRYYDWTSERSRMVNAIHNALRDADDNLSWYNGMKDEDLDADEIKERDEAINDLRSLIKYYHKSWKETCDKYSDPLGWRDYENKSIDFEEVCKEAIVDYYDYNDLARKTALETIEATSKEC